MARLLDPERHFAVERDGLPRVADYDDGSQHVLYLDGDLVRSLAAADWLATRGPLPSDPTPQESAMAIAARETGRATRQADAIILRSQIRTAARALAGKKPTQWNTQELRELVALLLHDGGYLEGDAALRDVGE